MAVGHTLWAASEGPPRRSVVHGGTETRLKAPLFRPGTSYRRPPSKWLVIGHASDHEYYVGAGAFVTHLLGKSPPTSGAPLFVPTWSSS